MVVQPCSAGGFDSVSCHNSSPNHMLAAHRNFLPPPFFASSCNAPAKNGRQNIHLKKNIMASNMLSFKFGKPSASFTVTASVKAASACSIFSSTSFA